jgi:hypothetical protein
MSDNTTFLAKNYFEQFLMLNKMVPKFAVDLGAFLAKITVAMATEIQNISILCNFVLLWFPW